MKRNWLIILTCILAFSLTAGSAFAKSKDKQEDSSNMSEHETKDGNNNDKNDAKGKDESVTSNTYGHDKDHEKDHEHGQNGYKGLFKAIENVSDKPAGVVIADLLLTKYGTQLTPELKAKLEAVIEKDAALSELADILDQKGSVTEAVYVGKEAIQANIKNMDSYKKVSKLYEKLGNTGVKLYVNGTEPASEVAPIISNGSTLVPFRAISESLQAKVTWNGEERSVTVIRNTVTVKLLIDSKIAYVNGVEKTLEVPATIVGGSTVVPARFLSEALNAVVKWDAETKSVVIYE
ncbi:copper amine oxidase N-terminal domain-containing protein [Paenibacillus sp. GP183]|uniref:copper amine oxidase N-terminal domain-containing protein n=1 Tax=Paenibacillus sp. GP183 TaxID=1882751 RepID=UPI000896E4C2|nr:copper amine oxidase N-terminal domain-containing protein [Paenibacillus sp. GP183]SEC46213.1 Copper amine oxidase N-terminal domain-containing protein [Paenibacillus sp. GP183]